MTTAFVFPGQGSQSVGMLSTFADENVVRETFAEARDALGYDLWALCQHGPETDLNVTWRTQPALLTASVALYRLWLSRDGAQPALLAGHSLGEYSALVCSGALAFADAVKLVEARGKFMQEAVPEGQGKMAAILGLDDADIQAACDESAQGEVVAPVNFNSPGQVVIAGNAAAVERAMEACKAKGAKRALPLNVSAPSHCLLMKPAAERLATLLQQITINMPAISVINNVDVAIETDPAKIRDALVRQLYRPVRWTESVQALAASGVTRLIECGSGAVLAGLAKRINKELTATSVQDKTAFDAALAG
ncbi:ACP S-malonyltransferase [Permianibacter sp. IMCC34836]|nr:ACP S-malonyltransferase [Permianibacter fluminis]